MGANLDLLKELFPRRAMLSVDEVAEVLAVGGAGGSYEQTRRELKEGRIIPGLRKMDGVWRVPITALAEAMDRMVEVEPVTAPAIRGRHRRKSSQPEGAPVPAYGSRGRRPDALRARMDKFLQTASGRWTALPMAMSPTYVPSSPCSQDDARARSRDARSLRRTQEFWEVVGALLLARDLEDLPPPSATSDPPRIKHTD